MQMLNIKLCFTTRPSPGILGTIGETVGELGGCSLQQAQKNCPKNNLCLYDERNITSTRPPLYIQNKALHLC